MEIPHLILGNQSGDLDSIACSLALAHALGENYSPILNFPSHELNLRKEALFLFDLLSINKKELLFEENLPSFLLEARKGILRVILVDHNRLKGGQEEWGAYVDQIIDHHVDEKIKYPHLVKANKLIDKVGSCATLITEIITQETFLTKELACLLLAPILLDTSNLLDQAKVTIRDTDAAHFLKERAGDLYSENFYEELLKRKSDVAFLSPRSLLKKDLKIYQEEDFTYGIASFPEGVIWNAENVREWYVALTEFLVEKDLKFLLVLQWIGKEKAVLFYSPYPEIRMKLLSQKFSNELFKPEVIPVHSNTLLLKLREPLARKSLQPLLHLL